MPSVELPKRVKVKAQVATPPVVTEALLTGCRSRYLMVPSVDTAAPGVAVFRASKKPWVLGVAAAVSLQTPAVKVPGIGIEVPMPATKPPNGKEPLSGAGLTPAQEPTWANG